ncbi:ankyrin [Penicillium odoratum]|uniref:ankyrin n=1 Tax=Penicillium odoratum TaxID=1167516 RepID=UPI0025467A92|nr:ankyrin [Penicillium odoratum]KAJ5752202.1 ankyrin [Penicillium odoratum]
MKIFWEAYEDPSWHLLFVAAKSSSFDAIRVMLEIYLENPTYTEPLDQYLEHLPFSPINVACAGAHRELTLWLIHHLFWQRNYIIGTSSGKHLYLALQVDQGCSVRDSNIYVEQNSNLNPQIERTVLGAAVPNASYKMVSRLVSEGAGVHAQQTWEDYDIAHRSDHIKDGKGVTAIHIASMFWNLEGIHALIDHRGDISVADMLSKADNYGRIPLHWALQGTRDEVYLDSGRGNQYRLPPREMEAVKLLLSADPDKISAQDRQGATVFNYVVRSDTPSPSVPAIVKVLLGAKPPTLNSRDFIGATALRDAVGYHAWRFQKFLIRNLQS